MVKNDLIYKLEKECLSGRSIPIDHMEVEKESLRRVPAFIKEKDYQQLMLIMDKNTKEAAGNKLMEYLKEAKIDVEVMVLPEDRHGHAIANEETMMQVFVHTSPSVDCFLAVGSGTIHDITRFVSSKMKVPFISIPTAASVDGFTSRGAPIILQGVKKTVQTSNPVAVFADLNVLKEAPRKMTAAGFGDMIGKVTSILDWNISYLVGGEPYNELAANITRQALKKCVEHIDELEKNEEHGIEVLMEALIQSGLVMLALDYSRPASGGEHHLSHYWEMDLLKKDEKQLLHGAKVGVATAIISDLYKSYLQEPALLALTEHPEWKERLLEYGTTIQEQVEQMPDSDEIKGWLQKAGGPVDPKEMGISGELVQASLNEAYHLRDRCTGLKLINVSTQKNTVYPI
ncbi:glycerol-1-phosphate dehydrogenase [NAD(P)+] [Salibacterium salarium]|uniref:sn-glycerol-1-phosphate dehydrogenase n=1 Tax=Salibacterium salarium TaxID=284579 RepID=UPI002788E578|nr:sn-glycerol-1-phosphate dehydrogenase [Salibacterium salarium]MDQ0300080.1 glycerol-1-phosphate dehydrogenase [NAD(P)+] [Salibacterium salarium]